MPPVRAARPRTRSADVERWKLDAWARASSRHRPNRRAFEKGRSRCWELNPEPRLYESRALPLSYIGATALRRTEASLKAFAAGVKASARGPPGRRDGLPSWTPGRSWHLASSQRSPARPTDIGPLPRGARPVTHRLPRGVICVCTYVREFPQHCARCRGGGDPIIASQSKKPLPKYFHWLERLLHCIILKR